MEASQIEFLKSAVIDLTIEKAQLKKDFLEKKKSSDQWYRYYSEQQKKVAEQKEVIEKLKSEITELQNQITPPHDEEN